MVEAHESCALANHNRPDKRTALCAMQVVQGISSYDSSADIWSFGITLLELACGKPPLATDRRYSATKVRHAYVLASSAARNVQWHSSMAVHR